MASAFIPLANVTLTSATNSVTFSNISGTYRDLMIVFSGQGSGADNIFVNINHDTTSANYGRVHMMGNGSTSGSSFASDNTLITLDPVQMSGIFHFLDYSTTNKNKAILARGDDSSAWVMARAMRWANNAAITSIKLSSGSVNFTSNSTFALYGVSA